jgi:hypothetical protein
MNNVRYSTLRTSKRRGITSHRSRGCLEIEPLGCLDRTAPRFFKSDPAVNIARVHRSRLQVDSSSNNRRRSTTSLSSHREQERAHDE